VWAAIAAQIRLNKEQNHALDIERSIRIHADKIASLDRYVLAEENVPEFIERLETIRLVAGASMRIVSLLADGGGKDPSLNIKLALVGSFANVTHFIQMLEALPLRTEIRTVTLSYRNEGVSSNRVGLPLPRGGGGDVEGPWSATVDMRIFGFIPKEEE